MTTTTEVPTGADPAHAVEFILNSRDYGNWHVALVEWTDGVFTANYTEQQPEWGAADELDEQFDTSPTVSDLLVRLDEVITTRSEIAHEAWLSSQYSY